MQSINFSLVVGALRSLQAVYDLTCSLRLLPAQQSVVWIISILGTRSDV